MSRCTAGDLLPLHANNEPTVYSIAYKVSLFVGVIIHSYAMGSEPLTYPCIYTDGLLP